MSGLYTFKKEERISSKKEIDFLFKNGTYFISYPIRILFCKKDARENDRFSVLISVPKRKFKRAVQRNRVKRLIRETYRLNKSILWNIPPEKCVGLSIGFIFVGNDIPNFKTVETAMIKALTSIKGQVHEK